MRKLNQKISAAGALQVFEELWNAPQNQDGSHQLQDVDEIIAVKNLAQISDATMIEKIIDEVLTANQKSVEEFKSGKEKAFQALVGQAMKASKGKANPAQVNEILKKKLSS